MHIKRRDFRNLNDKQMKELLNLNPRIFVVDGKGEVQYIVFKPNQESNGQH